MQICGLAHLRNLRFCDSGMIPRICGFWGVCLPTPVIYVTLWLVRLDLLDTAGPQLFQLEGKSLRLVRPLDRDKDDISSIVFQVRQALVRCCYITVDFATAAWQNVACITHEVCHIMLLFHNWSMIKDDSNRKCTAFCHILNKIVMVMMLPVM